MLSQSDSSSAASRHLLPEGEGLAEVSPQLGQQRDRLTKGTFRLGYHPGRLTKTTTVGSNETIISTRLVNMRRFRCHVNLRNKSLPQP